MLKLKMSGNVVDLHNHVHLKAYMYDRDINKRNLISGELLLGSGLSATGTRCTESKSH